MAVMIDQVPKNGGEKRVWYFLKDHTPDSWIVYNNRKINNYEFDVCILIPSYGLVVIEIKGWRSEDILSVTHDLISIDNFTLPQRNPDKQVTQYRYNLLNYFRERFNKNPKVMSMVWFTNITEEDYWQKRLDVPCPVDTTLFNSNLDDTEITVKKILDSFSSVTVHDPMTDEFVNDIRTCFEPGFKPAVPDPDIESEVPLISCSSYYSKILFLLEPLAETEVSQIVAEYFSGTKFIIFASKLVNLYPLLMAIKGQSDIFGIAIKSFSIEIASEHLKTVVPEKIPDEFRLFNFEVYQTSILQNYISQNSEIIDGKRVNEFDLLLSQLNEITNFNYGQYLIEHSCSSENTLVIAGAGTGKTYTMVTRVAFICLGPESKDINLSKDIAILTFTNKAAENMKSRIKALFLNYYRLTNQIRYIDLVEQMQLADISTIAKFCLDIIQSFSIFTGMGTDFKIHSNEYLRQKLYVKYLNRFVENKYEEDPDFIERLPRPLFALQKSLIQLANKMLNKSIDLKSITSKSLGREMNPTIPFYSEMIQKVLIPAETEFEELCYQSNCLDLNRVLSAIMSNPNRDLMMKSLPYRYLIIDEFQDTDDRQIEFFQLIQQIALNHPRFFVVGDLKQSIYRFRGATISAFDHIAQANLYPWNTFSLTKNYRTHKTLLKTFDSLFQFLGQKGYLKYSEKSDQLTSSLEFDDGISDEIRLTKVEVSSENPDIFYDQIIDEIKQQVEKIEENPNGYSSLNDRTIALLVRTNTEADHLITECRRRGLNIVKNTGENLFEQESTLDLQIMLNAILNHGNPVYLTALIESNYINSSINYIHLHNLEQQEKTTILTEILEKEFEKKCGKSWISLIKSASEKPALHIIHDLFTWLKPYSSLPAAQIEHYIQNFQFLIDHLISVQSDYLLTLSQIQNYLEVQILSGQVIETGVVKTAHETIPVICSTIHKAKGLEYGTVLLPYMQRNMDRSESLNTAADFKDNRLAYTVNIDGFGDECVAFNNFFDMDSESIESISEETRILYVGMTRAIHRLIWFSQKPVKHSLSWQGLLEKI